MSLVWSGVDTDGNRLLFNEAVPVVLDEVPGKQVAGEALTHSVDDQGQVLSPEEFALQTCIKDPARGVVGVCARRGYINNSLK